MPSGEFADRCPIDGCLEVAPSHRNAGGRGGDEYLRWNLFSADKRQGGCGASWSRTTRQGQAADAQRGVRSRWLTESATVDRTVSVPSEAFQRNWARAFGKED